MYVRDDREECAGKKRAPPLSYSSDARNLSNYDEIIPRCTRQNDRDSLFTNASKLQLRPK